MDFFNHIDRERVGQRLVQSSGAILALIFIAVAAELLPLNLATACLLDVIVIVLLARVGDFVASVVVSLIAALFLAYIAPPDNSLWIEDPFNAVAVITFLGISLIMARLVSRLHKMSEEALVSVNRKLIDAEERVRARIGQELHDDIEQRLALLTVEVARMSRDSTNLRHGVLNPMNGICEQTSRIAADVQALAYELCPYQLEYLGMATAMNSFCKRFGEQHNVEIDFTIRDFPKVVPLDVSL